MVMHGQVPELLRAPDHASWIPPVTGRFLTLGIACQSLGIHDQAVTCVLGLETMRTLTACESYDQWSTSRQGNTGHRIGWILSASLETPLLLQGVSQERADEPSILL